MKKVLSRGIVKAAELAAKKAVTRTSPWNHFQPKENESIRVWAANEEVRKRKQENLDYFMYET